MTAKHDRAQIAGEIGELMKLLDLDTSAQLASLLRNSGDTYPSSGLIRTYLNMLADPADKFVRLLRARRAEVDGQLREGVQALQIADQLQAIYHVLPKQHIITILTEDQLNQADYQHAQTGGLAVTVLASLAIPGTWLHTCEICNRPFVARSSTSKCCYRRDDAGRLVCRLEARRRSYRERAKQARRAARKAQKGVQVFDMALPPKAF